MLQSTARVATERPERYIKQLVSHLGHRLTTELTDEGIGVITMPGGGATLSPETGILVIDAHADDSETLERAKDVVARHLVRFASNEDLVVEWA
jgi:hypothetical protein